MVVNNLIKRSGLFLATFLFTFFTVSTSVLAAIVIDEYPGLTANSQPHGKVQGPDGNMWFTGFNTDQVGRMSPDGSTVHHINTDQNARASVQNQKIENKL